MTAIGEVDEANAAIGVAIATLTKDAITDHLQEIQNDLFDLGADFATSAEIEGALRMVPAQVEWLEARIDALNESLEPLTSFILPGGSEAAARVHVARTAVRRAERTMAALTAAEAVNPAALAYVNRLSDYLFVLARALNHGRDPLWVPGANR